MPELTNHHWQARRGILGDANFSLYVLQREDAHAGRYVRHVHTPRSGECSPVFAFFAEWTIFSHLLPDQEEVISHGDDTRPPVACAETGIVLV